MQRRVLLPALVLAAMGCMLMGYLIASFARAQNDQPVVLTSHGAETRIEAGRVVIRDHRGRVEITPTGVVLYRTDDSLVGGLLAAPGRPSYGQVFVVDSEGQRQHFGGMGVEPESDPSDP